MKKTSSSSVSESALSVLTAAAFVLIVMIVNYMTWLA
jgi:hypothetical protein